MREILFRGKRVDNDEWVYGSFCMDACEQKNGLCGVDGFIRLCDFENAKMRMYEVDRETVGQFTGLADKNGKRIFEGDICTYPDGWVDYAGDGVETFSIGVVAWEEKNPSFYLTNNIGVEWDEIWDAVDEITVIGNIHDNPELLEGA